MFDIQELIVAQSPHYEAEFGVVPRFRAGIHGGPVVASEVGDDKREIVYFGDTVNTAARLVEQLNLDLENGMAILGRRFHCLLRSRLPRQPREGALHSLVLHC